ncbi:MAG: DUF4394 domain-containing protein [Xanthobacteraceae bacterium]|nr:DUF4394 domain-containing protein [Xanthobacteraceae bacterium]MBX3533028.1 DUF4394 domain-containing protein [Xanthobacteraceae bacterium]MCW5676134.1 DUF4394 domain-containing protein [Xanthobacteraceae bacterium]MCW5677424.1 DUF4394 domain-containing protein [Xanthobacteraceae bacterium]
MFNRKTLLAAALAAGSLSLVSAASAQTIVALSNNALTMIDAKSMKTTATVKIAGGTVIGIDVRPADGQIYGVTSNGWIVTIDPKSGKLTQKAEMSVKLKNTANATIDFNPVADRLRVMSPDGTNLRVNVDDGKVIEDGTLKFAETDMHKGERPNVVAAAYTNSIKGTKETVLYDIDATIGALLRQAPPNDGVLNAVGKLGFKVNGPVAFNIVPAGEGENVAWLANAGTLYKVDLKTGKATPAGKLPAGVTDIAYLN